MERHLVKEYLSLRWSGIFFVLLNPKTVYLTDKRSPLQNIISVEPSPFLHMHFFQDLC
jgi:hypothetical protein